MSLDTGEVVESPPYIVTITVEEPIDVQIQSSSEEELEFNFPGREEIAAGTFIPFHKKLYAFLLFLPGMELQRDLLDRTRCMCRTRTTAGTWQWKNPANHSRRLGRSRSA